MCWRPPQREDGGYGVRGVEEAGAPEAPPPGEEAPPPEDHRGGPRPIGRLFPLTVLLIAAAAAPLMKRIPALPPGTSDTTLTAMTATCSAAPSAVSAVLCRCSAAYRVPPSAHRYTANAGEERSPANSLAGPRSTAADAMANREPSDHSSANFRAPGRQASGSGAQGQETPLLELELELEPGPDALPDQRLDQRPNQLPGTGSSGSSTAVPPRAAPPLGSLLWDRYSCSCRFSSLQVNRDRCVFSWQLSTWSQRSKQVCFSWQLSTWSQRSKQQLSPVGSASSPVGSASSPVGSASSPVGSTFSSLCSFSCRDSKQNLKPCSANSHEAHRCFEEFFCLSGRRGRGGKEEEEERQ
ncbi:hypothetical protein F7725_010776 [Dissostichus mawsoni]|uniref:Uncharacterized protein n=1 Tax=Dissostichus mawsoni TaxID=36200 RepID=A0A7J5Z740_DISMA|nr:hypothetical protein F7725_010776 [Dissostichus mawsoni]